MSLVSYGSMGMSEEEICCCPYYRDIESFCLARDWQATQGEMMILNTVACNLEYHDPALGRALEKAIVKANSLKIKRTLCILPPFSHVLCLAGQLGIETYFGISLAWHVLQLFLRSLELEITPWCRPHHILGGYNRCVRYSIMYVLPLRLPNPDSATPSTRFCGQAPQNMPDRFTFLWFSHGTCRAFECGLRAYHRAVAHFLLGVVEKVCVTLHFDLKHSFYSMVGQHNTIQHIYSYDTHRC
ncbi:hypothetical protein EDC04DRAFT_2694942 [Pisolithus marmoratus]|nr:hypothetical protein EDC04DRAFT_2694942 [Pisolithus marmoratus]